MKSECCSCRRHPAILYCQQCVNEMIEEYIVENRELYRKIKELEKRCTMWEDYYKEAQDAEDY